MVGSSRSSRSSSGAGTLAAPPPRQPAVGMIFPPAVPVWSELRWSLTCLQVAAHRTQKVVRMQCWFCENASCEIFGNTSFKTCICRLRAYERSGPSSGRGISGAQRHISCYKYFYIYSRVIIMYVSCILAVINANEEEVIIKVFCRVTVWPSWPASGSASSN